MSCILSQHAFPWITVPRAWRGCCSGVLSAKLGASAGRAPNLSRIAPAEPHVAALSLTTMLRAAVVGCLSYGEL